MIKETLPDDLRAAMTRMEPFVDETTGYQKYPGVDHIKIVVKQIKGYESMGFSDEMAGALTGSTVRVVKELCIESVGAPNQVVDRRKDATLGSLFIATNLGSGQKFQVTSMCCSLLHVCRLYG